MLLAVHIAAGGFALALGAVTLSVRKGGTLHRGGGRLFVYAMTVMAVSAALLGNPVAGLMTLYFISTGWAAAQRTSPWARRTNAAAAVLAVGLALIALVGGIRNIGSPALSSGGVRLHTIGVMSCILAAALLVSAVGDVRVMRFGLPDAGRRLARHLWRMCFALAIAGGSFFSIRERVARVLPEALTTAPLRALPMVLLCGVMCYWLWRVRGRRTPKRLMRYESRAAPPRRRAELSHRFPRPSPH